MKYIKLFEQRYEYFDLMTMGSGELIELLKSEIEKKDYDIEYIKEIIEWGHFNIDVLWEEEDNVQWSFLMRASVLGKADIIKALLDGGANPNLKNEWGYTALMIAARWGRTQAVQELLKHPKINPNLKDEWGYTALMKAAIWKRTQAVQELLKHPDIDPNLQDNEGYTALMYAARKGHTQAVQELLKHPSIDINAQDIYGETALMKAGFWNRSNVVKELLNHPSINKKILNNKGQTAWNMANGISKDILIDKL